MENNPGARETFGLYILNGLGELQARMLRFPERRSAMSAAWAQLRIRVGCFALLARVRNDTWISCSVFALSDGQLAQVSEHRQHAGASSMDVNAVGPASYAGSALRHTMDII